RKNLLPTNPKRSFLSTKHLPKKCRQIKLPPQSQPAKLRLRATVATTSKPVIATADRCLSHVSHGISVTASHPPVAALDSCWTGYCNLATAGPLTCLRSMLTFNPANVYSLRYIFTRRCCA